MIRWKKHEEDWLIANYSQRGQKYCAEYLNRPLPSIRMKTSRLGLTQDQQSEFFKDWQTRAKNSKIGKKRPEQALVMKRNHKEGKLGTKENRKTSGRILKKWRSENEHPRGMLGKKHHEETLKIMSINTINMWKDPNFIGNSEEYRQKISDRVSLMHSNGTYRNNYSRCKRGERHDLGPIFFRSSWEANYARYLNFLIEHGSIHRWEFEPDTYWFNEIKRGTRSYLPDFKIWDTPESVPYYVEVKGWMDAKSKTKLKRMAKYYPHITVHLVAPKEYYAIRNKVAKLIPEWE